MSEEAQWVPPPFGSPCWIEIPAVDVTACKVNSFPAVVSSLPWRNSNDPLTNIPWQEFYEKLFPAWTWMPSTERHPEDKLAMFKFSGPEGAFVSISISQPEKDSF
jgi:hypothetical protein